jgi:hypothetical protein
MHGMIRINTAAVGSIKALGQRDRNFHEEDGIGEVLPDLTIIRSSHIAPQQPIRSCDRRAEKDKN